MSEFPPMTNLEYRQSRHTDHPFVTTPEQAKQAWLKMNADTIEEKRLAAEEARACRESFKKQKLEQDED